MNRPQNALVFVAGSIVGGLALAFVAVALRPELLRSPRFGSSSEVVARAGAVSASRPPLDARAPSGPADSMDVDTRPAGGNGRAGPGSSSGAASGAENRSDLGDAARGRTSIQTDEAGRGTARHATSYASAVERAAPAVVNIYTARLVTERVPRSLFEDPFGEVAPRYRQRVEQSLGSGVILDASGHIVTNHHVIAEADRVRVQLADGREADAKVVGRDPDTDLAVLSISLPRLPVMPLGRSDALRVGDVVLAIGNPIGLSQTVTQGIVSATGRGQLGVATFENFIQTDAPINVGNSGGALIDVEGQLVGINTAVIAKNLGVEGIGFAIPVNLVRGVVDALIVNGRVVRGWIGVALDDVDAAQARQIGLARGGVLVTGLYRDAPALAAGLRPGDLVLAIDGRELRSAQDALARIAAAAPGARLRLRIQRAEQAGDLDVPVAERPTRRSG